MRDEGAGRGSAAWAKNLEEIASRTMMGRVQKLEGDVESLRDGFAAVPQLVPVAEGTEVTEVVNTARDEIVAEIRTLGQGLCDLQLSPSAATASSALRESQLSAGHVTEIAAQLTEEISTIVGHRLQRLEDELLDRVNAGLRESERRLQQIFQDREHLKNEERDRVLAAVLEELLRDMPRRQRVRLAAHLGSLRGVRASLPAT